jgi:GNAT superfamily N-acetyltransferase
MLAATPGYDRTVIEEAEPEDLPGAVGLMNLVYTDSALSLEQYRHFVATRPARAVRKQFKAVIDGELVGWGIGGLHTNTSTPGVAFVGVTVHPGFRGRGLGTALLDVAEQHVLANAATSVRADSPDDRDARQFASRRGYRHTFTRRISSVDPRTVPEVAPLPTGVELVPFAAFDDPAPIHHVDVISSRDVPGDDAWDHMPLDEWTRQYWESPSVDREASMTAVVDGTVASITMIHLDRATGRAENDITGTLPEFRGRGLAQLVKHRSLRRAGELGVTVVFTENDETNEPMLAVNTKLGYRLCSARLTWVRDF